MKNKYYISLLIIIFSSSICAQSWTLSNILFGTGDITEIQSATASDGSIIVLGHFTETIESSNGISLTTNGGRDYFLSKMNSVGEIEWIKQLGGPSNEFFIGGVTVSDNDIIYATGSFDTYLKYTPTDSIAGTGLFDIFVCKVDLEGNFDWCKNLGSGNGDQRSTAIKTDRSGDILISGYFNDSIQIDDNFTLHDENTFADFFYGKLDPVLGDAIWIKQISTLSGSVTNLSIEASDNYYLFINAFNDSIQIANDTIVSETKTRDLLFFKTDLEGNVDFSRKIYGGESEFSYSVSYDTDNNIYIAGYYNSSYLTVESSNDESTTLNENQGDYDIFILKYSPTGELIWFKTNGGLSTDRIYDMTFYDNQIHVTGLFKDQLEWGGITLTTNGISDQDMFYGSLDLSGNYRSANSYKGRNNSSEEAREIFYSNETLLTVIRSNSDLLVLGDSIYTNPSQNYFIAIGAIGCLPINITPSQTNVTGCYGDQTGSIFVGTSGGFGGPYRYSIDDGDTYQDNNPNFTDLPAGVYPTVVVDNSNCVQTGSEVTITEPDEVTISNVASEDALCYDDNGSINVDATGGTGTLSFSVDGGGTFPNTVGTAVNVPAGVYNITVKDNNDCIAEGGTATILEPEELAVTLLSTSDVTCNGNMDGSIEVSAAGGTVPYEYSIDGSIYQAETTLGSLTSGTYTPLVRDANGCETLLDPEVKINEPDELIITLVSSSDITNETDGEIVVSASGGTAPLTFTITPTAGTQNPDTVFTFSAGEGGDYIVEVDDSNNCGPVSTSTITISDLTNISNLDLLNASIFPNPSSGMITVEFNTDKSEMTMEVFSIDGRNVVSRQVSSAGGQVKETLDLSGLDKGMYMIRVDQQTLSSAVVLN